MTPNETKIINIPLQEPLKLKRGGSLDSLEVAYEAYGTYDKEKCNAVLICHPLTMDAHVSNNGNSQVESGWWNYFVGPGKAIDSDQFYVICFNVLGGCKGSTGPLSLKDDGTPYRTDFPIITVEDMVKVQHLALDHLGIDHLYAIVGGSLGGMQVLEWSVRFPTFMDKAIAMATGANLSPQGLAFDIIGRQSILNDASWQNGEYSNDDDHEFTGLKVARMIGHLTYISKKAMDEKFGRELQRGMLEDHFNTQFAIESFLRYQGDKFVKRFDPNSYLYLSKAMDLYDLKEGFETLAESLSRCRCSFLVISYSSDELYPPEQSMELVAALMHNGIKVTYTSIKTDMGHDAFLIDEPDKLQDKYVNSFLER